MALPLMPKATAVWLVENTTLTFEQIAEFCGLHALEIQGVADGEVAVGIRGMDPITSGQISRDEIIRCEMDSKAHLVISAPVAEIPKRVKSARYTPVSKRQERPNGIAWLIKNYPELSDAQIGRLLGTTKTTITAVRDRTHWNAQHISPQDPILLGICGEVELVEAVNFARRRQERAAKKKQKNNNKENVKNLSHENTENIDENNESGHISEIESVENIISTSTQEVTDNDYPSEGQNKSTKTLAEEVFGSKDKN